MSFRNHRFSRLELLVGRQGLDRYKNLHVCVVGLGGVGSFAAEALARSAIGYVTLVDHDEICATNVNRQIHAFTNTVGEKKAKCLVERFSSINPHGHYIGIEEHHHPDRGDFIFEEAEKRMGRKIDAVIDCIDTLLPKVDLIKRCLDLGIPLWSSMGCASRMDPSKIEVADISETKVDPFARVLRAKLRDVGVTTGFRTVFSTEEPIDPEQAIPGTEWLCICPNRDKDFGACHQKRVMLGTNSFIPPIFGMRLAGDYLNWVVKDLDFKNRDSFDWIPTYEEGRRVNSLSSYIISDPTP